MNIFKKIRYNKKLRRILCVALAAVIVLSSIFGVIGLTKGEKIDVEQEVNTYNSSRPDFSYLFKGVKEEAVALQIDETDEKLAAMIAEYDVDSLIYNDTVATMVTKLLADVCKADLASIKFKELKKNFKDGYNYLVSLQEANKTWADVEEIPFGIEDGDKDAFVKACGAASAHLGKTLIKVVLAAPSAYNDALVPAFESIHTGKMPSFLGFVMRTGLSNSKRIEFMINKVLSIVDPIKEAPLTYLCTMMPDFIINYRKACDFINGNEKISKKTGLTMPTIDSILNQVVSALGVTLAEVDLDLLSKTGTASVAKSGGTGGKRVEIIGDREIVYGVVGGIVVDTVCAGNNLETIEHLLTFDLKSSDFINSKFGPVLYSQKVNELMASFLDALCMTKTVVQENVPAKVDAYNAEANDFSSLFSWPLSEDSVDKLLTAADLTLNHCIANGDFAGAFYNDAFATTISKLFAKLCTKELKDISFYSVSKYFPEAHKFLRKAQQEGKTWDDIDVIPFGVTPGDKEAFIKAAAAGSEAFGDALALACMVDPTAYDNGLLPLLEAIHVGPMPTFEEFVASSGLDGCKRMEDIVSHMIKMLEPITVYPLEYLLEMLPDLVANYNKASSYLSQNEVIKNQVGIVVPPLSELMADLVSGIGITLPEYDFSQLEKMAVACAADSGDICGQRVELKGKKAVVFMAISNYLVEVIKYEGNLKALFDFATGSLDLSTASAATIVDTVGSLGDVAQDAVAIEGEAAA